MGLGRDSCTCRLWRHVGGSRTRYHGYVGGPGRRRRLSCSSLPNASARESASGSPWDRTISRNRKVYVATGNATRASSLRFYSNSSSPAVRKTLKLQGYIRTLQLAPLEESDTDRPVAVDADAPRWKRGGIDRSEGAVYVLRPPTWAE